MQKFYIITFCLLLIIASLVFPIRGIYVNKTPILALDRVTQIEAYDFEKPGERIQIDNCIDKFLKNNINYKLINGNISTAHHTYGFRNSERFITAYIWSVQQEYKVVKGNINYGVSFSQPLAIKLKRSVYGEYSVVSCEAPFLGEGYKESLAELFPDEYLESILNKENVQGLEIIVNNSILKAQSAVGKQN